jgi:glutaminyl-peptide cyclotransferase
MTTSVMRPVLLIGAACAAMLVASPIAHIHAAQAKARPKPAAPAAAAAVPAAPMQYGYKVVNKYPHDRTAYTQGLEYREGVLYEGTGLNGRSTLRKVKLETGEVLQQVHIGDAFFGEGITVLPQQIVQLTWQAGMGFVYDRSTLRMLHTFNYPGEGWGLTNDGKRIFMSDGTAQLRRWDYSTLAEQQRVTVRDGDKEIAALNELEFVKGEVYANVYTTDRIARINPETGKVVGWINMDGLLPASVRAETDVLNGIAYDAAKDRLFVTGKLWPTLFEIQLVPAAARKEIAKE